MSLLNYDDRLPVLSVLDCNHAANEIVQSAAELSMIQRIFLAHFRAAIFQRLIWGLGDQLHQILHVRPIIDASNAVLHFRHVASFRYQSAHAMVSKIEAKFGKIREGNNEMSEKFFKSILRPILWFTFVLVPLCRLRVWTFNC